MTKNEYHHKKIYLHIYACVLHGLIRRRDRSEARGFSALTGAAVNGRLSLSPAAAQPSPSHLLVFIPLKHPISYFSFHILSHEFSGY